MICIICREAADGKYARQHHCNRDGQWCTCQHKVPEEELID